MGKMKSTSKGTGPQNTAVGSGSRPTGGKIPIPTSSPASAKNLRGGKK